MRSRLVRVRSSLERMRSSLVRMRSSLERMRSSLERMRSSLLRIRSSVARMRSSLVVRASDCHCTRWNGPGFDPSIRRHSGIWGVADEAVLNKVTLHTAFAFSLWKKWAQTEISVLSYRNFFVKKRSIDLFSFFCRHIKTKCSVYLIHINKVVPLLIIQVQL